MLVAMSGGVDSSVVAVLLHRLGYKVTGATLQLAAPSCGLGACCTGRDLEDVKKMCAYEGFAHHLVLARDEFKEKVINYTVDMYGQGMTPSPCVWCNSKVRFTNLLETMQKYDCDIFVTGHYAYITHDHKLLSGIDPHKDQSYFLSMLPSSMLPYIRFPLGNMTKPTVRKIAKRLGIPVATKQDSQDLCFVKDSYQQTLWQLNPHIFKPGEIKTTQGEIVGTHDGIVNYTIGQRKGISALRDISSQTKPLYVVDINPINNEVIVGDQSYTAAKYIHLINVNLISDYKEGMFVNAKLRARSPTYLARLWNNGSLVEFMVPIENAVRGQICVMYHNREVIGAGLIQNFTKAKKQYIT